MIEGDFPKARENRQGSGNSADSGPLHELSWSDLRARFEAACDLRAALSEEGMDGPASFDADSARRIAALANSKPVVNRDDLANGKAAGDISGAGATGDRPGTRGSE